MLAFKKFKNSAMLKSRSQKLDHFYSQHNADCSVLDVGVSSNERNDATNLFLRNYKFDSSLYTGLAVQSMDDIRRKYPEKRFVEYDGGGFPFAENEFEWVFSNAVIEHVGNETDQLAFLNEMLRVGKSVFFTTPNKWFPIESHTNVFLKHWNNNKFYAWCEANASFWGPDNLLLLGKKDLDRIMQLSTARDYIIKSNRTLGWPMTYTVVCSKGGS